MSVLKSVKRVANGSLQAELMDSVEKPGVVNVLAKLNKGDSRFKDGSQRRAWFPVTIQSLQEMGVSEVHIKVIDSLKESQSHELEFDKPTIDGFELRIQVIESTLPDTWQRQNTMKAAKQIMINESVAKNKALSNYDLSQYQNKNGYFVDAEGNFIFSKTTVTITPQLRHQFVPGMIVPETELASYGATLAENVNVSEREFSE